MKCQSRILREFKTRKAEAMWPQTVYGPTDVSKHPEVCNGDVTVVVKAVDDPYFGGSSAKLEAEFVCTRCNAPFVPRRLEFESRIANGELDVTDLVQGD